MKVAELKIGRYPPAIVLSPEEPVLTVIQEMAEKWVRHAILVNDANGKIEGMVSARDVIDFLAFYLKFRHLQDKYGSNLYDALTHERVFLLRYDAPYVRLSDDFRSVVETMIDRGVGALAVLDDEDKPVGIISERHIMSLFADVPMYINVSEIMSSPIISLTPSASLKQCQDTMCKYRIRRIVIMEGNSLRGILTVKDIIRYYASQETLEALQREGVSAVYPVPALRIARESVITIEDNADLGEAISIMREHNIGSLVVTKHGEPIGILTERDIIKKLPRLKGVEVFVDEAEKLIVAGRVSF